MQTIRINAWSSPRNISTALMYSFAQRPDITVVDEPLFAHYLLRATDAAPRPSKAEVLATMENDGAAVVKNVILGDYETPIVFFKQMTHHLIELDRSFLQETKNILLIRDPRRIIASFTKVVPNPSIHDIGVEMQYELYQQLQATNSLTAIVDAKDVLLQPRHMLQLLCERLNIPFYDNMLRWAAAPRPEDGVWAKYWYHNLHQSTGFQPYQDKTIQLQPEMELLAKRCQPFYETLYEQRMY